MSAQNLGMTIIGSETCAKTKTCYLVYTVSYFRKIDNENTTHHDYLKQLTPLRERYKHQQLTQNQRIFLGLHAYKSF